jgi:hypothetical protein
MRMMHKARKGEMRITHKVLVVNLEKRHHLKDIVIDENGSKNIGCW